MTRTIWTLTVACLLALGAGVVAEPLSEKETNILKQRLVPLPKLVVFNEGPEVVLDGTLTVNVELAEIDADAKKLVGASFERQFGAKPNIVVAKKDDVPKGAEAYRIRAAGKTVTLSASNVQGIRYALATLRQLAEPNRGTPKTVDYRIPETEIDDAPAMPFRSALVVWYNETSATRIEQVLRLAAYYKFNHLLLEFRGNYPYKKHPELRWAEFKIEPDNVKRLVALGKELGITLVPLFPLFGHAAGAKEATGKHAVLDLHPEYWSLFEPDGWCWCLSNPEARKTLTDIVLELHELFDNPPYFHIGCDEAYTPAECRACRRANYKALLKDHLLYFHKLLAERNCRVMMWHDMLIAKSDPRWKGYTAVGNEHTEGLIDHLPKDIMICDWQYRAPKTDEQWPTMRFFKEQGFSVLACPWDNMPGMRSLAKTVPQVGADGMLCTTWYKMSGPSMLSIFSTGAQTMWRADEAPVIEGRDARHVFNMHWRQIGWDIPIKHYHDAGYINWDIAPETFQKESLP